MKATKRASLLSLKNKVHFERQEGLLKKSRPQIIHRIAFLLPSNMGINSRCRGS